VTPVHLPSDVWIFVFNTRPIAQKKVQYFLNVVAVAICLLWLFHTLLHVNLPTASQTNRAYACMSLKTAAD